MGSTILEVDDDSNSLLLGCWKQKMKSYSINTQASSLSQFPPYQYRFLHSPHFFFGVGSSVRAVSLLLFLRCCCCCCCCCCSRILDGHSGSLLNLHCKVSKPVERWKRCICFCCCYPPF